jgi:hypothetical protein
MPSSSALNRKVRTSKNRIKTVYEAKGSVFISYRRTTSQYQALLVYKHLKQEGYDVFFDYQSIDSGKFASQILRQIACRNHFIVILSLGCLDRTVRPQDWLRREIEYAMGMQRNIVPLLFDRFEFGANKKYLTGKLSTLKDYNGVPVPDGYFDEAMEKLRNRFLKLPVKGTVQSAPSSDINYVQKVLQRANNAAEKEPALLAARKYVGNRRVVRRPTLPTRRTAFADLMLAGPSQEANKTSPVPATSSLLGRQPIQGELVYLAEPAYKTFLLEGHNGRIIVTDKRLIFIDFKDNSHSFEISMVRLASAQLEYNKFLDIWDRFTIQTRDGKKYFVDMGEPLKNRVERLIRKLSSPSSSSLKR